MTLPDLREVGEADVYVGDRSLAEACARGGGSKVATTVELLKTVVFSWLIGNGDLHGKNLSIYDPDGVWQPTPAYDPALHAALPGMAGSYGTQYIRPRQSADSGQLR
ncbi:HipA domain-containing protein [Mycobacterium sp. 21AC1]|uniref:HipA domain-containing protein n=1 Tax=[Mycobacterium] appelbergii TaxID=2939269 RepID=UPI0029393A38|nr:HipA domain-containing protein [Mycobacterium sp. 21AC1]MDV3129580.1 HipA domain-containing protein [Mycobacterium sp. 21AC1]